MKQIPLFLLFGLIIITSCKTKQSKNETKDKYENSKLTIEEVEKKSPERFLTVIGKDKHNIIGQTVVKGTITNKATVVAYKDVIILISFFSKTGALLEEDEEVIYETLKPGTSNNFKSKYFPPKGTDNITMKIKTAGVEN